MKILLTFAFLLLTCFQVDAATLYFSSAGSGSRAGTSCADTSNTTRCPFTQFVTLVAGDTGIIKNGTHNNTAISISCPGHANGTASLPIILRSETERQAHLVGNGTNNVITIGSCAYWHIEGFYITGPSQADALILLNNDHNITVRRNLLYNTNNPGTSEYNTHGIAVYGNAGDSQGNLVEENEIYFMSRHAIYLGFNQAEGNIVRRNYANLRSSAGAGAVPALYSGSNNIIENNIGEGGAYFANISAYGVSSNNIWVGNIGIGSSMKDECRQGSPGRPSANTWSNNVTISSNDWGFLIQGASSDVFNNNMAFSSTNDGGLVYTNPFRGNDCDASGTPSMSGQNNLMVSNPVGFSMGIAGWTLNRPDAYGNSTNFSPASSDSRYTSPTTTNPSLGDCKIYIPSTSPMHNAGVGGNTDIGANILYRYVDGKLTSTPLWDFSQTAGRRGEPYRSGVNQWVGAQVAGINDVAGQSLFDVQKRLGFGDGSAGQNCPSPSLISAPVVTVNTANYTTGTQTPTTLLQGTASGTGF